MITPIPNSAGLDEGDRFVEYNTCHDGDGRFCSGKSTPDAHGFSQGKGKSFAVSRNSYTDRLLGKQRSFGVETHTTVNGQRVGKTVGVTARSKEHAMAQARAAGYNANAAWEAPSKFTKDKGPTEHLHRGFTIRQDGDGYSASHPTYRAARPTGKTLGDVKTQINMFATGVRNAAARRRRRK